MAPMPMIRMPVPKKKDDAMETPKYLRKMTFRKVYRLAQPRLIIIFERIARIREPILTSKEAPTSRPATTLPIR